MKIKTKVKAGKHDGGIWEMQHNQTVAVKVKTNVKAGASNGDIIIATNMTLPPNHNQTLGLKVKSGIKAGPQPSDQTGDPTITSAR